MTKPEKELIVVYQDCITCGSRKEWGDKTIKTIKETGVKFRKLSFASAEAESYAMKAVEAGIKGYPYITDGTKFSQNIEDFTQTQETPKTTAKRAKKTKKEPKDGAISTTD